MRTSRWGLQAAAGRRAGGSSRQATAEGRAHNGARDPACWSRRLFPKMSGDFPQILHRGRRRFAYMGIQRSRARALDSSAETFRGLVERHQGRVFSIALRIVGESGAAEEVAQDVFLELHRNLGRLENGEHAAAWVRRVACHRATDALRRRAARGDAAAEEYQDGMALRPAAREFLPLLNRVEQLLLTLPPAQRTVMVLRYQEDLEPEEIAMELKMPVATVRSSLQRAVKMLRAKAERTLKEYSRG